VSYFYSYNFTAYNNKSLNRPTALKEVSNKQLNIALIPLAKNKIEVRIENTADFLDINQPSSTIFNLTDYAIDFFNVSNAMVNTQL
jgi:hypothetical protein